MNKYPHMYVLTVRFPMSAEKLGGSEMYGGAERLVPEVWMACILNGVSDEDWEMASKSRTTYPVERNGDRIFIKILQFIEETVDQTIQHPEGDWHRKRTTGRFLLREREGRSGGTRPDCYNLMGDLVRRVWTEITRTMKVKTPNLVHKDDCRITFRPFGLDFSSYDFNTMPTEVVKYEGGIHGEGFRCPVCNVKGPSMTFEWRDKAFEDLTKRVELTKLILQDTDSENEDGDKEEEEKVTVPDSLYRYTGDNGRPY